MPSSNANLSLNRIGALISIIGAASLVLSVAYDYSYFWMFDLSFAELPTSLADHIRSSLAFFPFMVLCIFSIMVLELFTRRIEQGMTEEEIINSSSNPRLTAKFRNSPYIFIMCLIPIPIILYLIGVNVSTNFFALSIMTSWFVAHDFFFSHKRIVAYTSKEFYLATRWIPFALIWVTSWGLSEAEIIKNTSVDQYAFNLKGGLVERGTIIRSFDGFFIIWQTDENKAQFINSANVISFQLANNEDEGAKPNDQGIEKEK